MGLIACSKARRIVADPEVAAPARAHQEEKMTPCICCGELVADSQAEEHLRLRHPAPQGGFLFYVDAQSYYLPEPSLLVGELLTKIGGQLTYQFYEKRDGQDWPLSHGQAVDLTNGPHYFVLVPPATY